MKRFSSVRSFALFCVRWFGILTGCVIAMLTMIVIVGNVIIYTQLNSMTSAEQSPDVILVLGYKIEDDPLQPTLLLEHRLQAVHHYWLMHPNAMIIVSGGRTQNYAKSEAEVMRRYLIQQGVPSEKILLEDQSTRTAHQFVNALQLMAFEQAVIVTSDFHLPRALLLAQRAGIINGMGVAATTPTDAESLFVAHIREPFALLNSWLFD